MRDRELRLTESEIDEVMCAFNVALSDTEVELVATHTEGWMAAVQMAAVSLRGRSDTEHFLAALAKTPRAVTDFLGTEVLDRQPSEIHDFLLATSVLDVLDVESCRAITSRADAGSMLGRLEERNLFLIELD
mgnify:CR=1 FL=1